MSLISIVGLLVLVTALTRFIRKSPVLAGARAYLSERSSLLGQLLACPHCLSFWLALCCAAIAFWWTREWLDFGIIWLLGWRGSYYINRTLDAKKINPEVQHNEEDKRCYICDKTYDQETFLERRNHLFCSHRCWFDYLRDQPKPIRDLIDDSGEIIRQEIYPMSFQEINPTQAKELLDSDQDYVYIDVRSEPEFENGHPAGSVNIPIAHRAQDGMVPNPDFLTVVPAHYERDSKLLLGCQMGGRSGRAAEALVAAGYTAVANVMGGYGGARDQLGNLVEKGWLELGLPVDYGADEGQSYESIKS